MSLGRVKSEDEAFEFEVSMPETERFSNAIDWIDLSFVERDRTPRWAIEVGIRCHLSGMSLRDTSQFLGELGVQRSHVADFNWVHRAELQPIATLSANQLAVDEEMIRLHGKEFWLYGAVDPETNEIIALRLYPTTNEVATRWFLDQLYHRCNLAETTILVDNAAYLTGVLADDGYRFRYEPDGNRNAIERVFREVERRTSSFSNSFSHVE